MALCPRCGAIVTVREGQSISCPACGMLGRRKPPTKFERPRQPWVLPVLVVLFIVMGVAGWLYFRST